MDYVWVVTRGCCGWNLRFPAQGGWKVLVDLV
jgi:hypothetical protein